MALLVAVAIFATATVDVSSSAVRIDLVVCAILILEIQKEVVTVLLLDHTSPIAVERVCATAKTTAERATLASLVVIAYSIFAQLIEVMDRSTIALLVVVATAVITMFGEVAVVVMLNSIEAPLHAARRLMVITMIHSLVEVKLVVAQLMALILVPKTRMLVEVAVEQASAVWVHAA